MTESTLLLVLAYVALTALITLSLLRAPFHWSLKLLLVLATCALYFVSYQGWREVQGWPVSSPLPARFQLHAAIIDEPDKTSGSPGTIHVWITDLSAAEPAEKPRAYRLDYQKSLHTNLQEALRNLRNGVIQLGRIKESGVSGMPRDFTRMGEKRQQLEIYSLPDPALPEK
ncbi:MAG: hypothetical protein JAY63_20505 [Candidatus Thiodiazotropha taylori]|nr:hypothetical protein [Candidatus Thiodiazotropha taylori]